MARSFEIAPQQIVLGTATNGFRLTFFYDFVDHSLCKMVVDNIAGTLAASTECVIPRNARETVSARTTSIPAQDSNVAIPLEIGQGGPEDNSVTPRSNSFGI
jgi:hypothetical protein